MKKITKILFLNQVAGSLFKELAEDLSINMSKKCELFTGHLDTLKKGSSTCKLIITKAPPYNRKNKFFRVFSWINYSILAFWKMLKVNDDTIIFVVSNPPFLGFFALLVNLIKKTRYVILIYDMHVDVLIGLGFLDQNSFVVKLWKLINLKVWDRSIGVYTIGKVMAENLNKQFNVKNTKLSYVGVVYPWTDTKLIKPISKIKNPLSSKFGQQRKITIMYSGNMGMSHDIESILEAAKILKNNFNISFLLIGEGEKWQKAADFQKENKLGNLQVLPLQPENILPYTISLADIALVSLENGAECFMIPSKMFHYMSAGAALIAICKGKNDVSNIIKNSNCGITVEPKNPKELARAIEGLSKDFKKLNIFKNNSRKSTLAHFSRKKCTKKFNQEFLSLIN